MLRKTNKIHGEGSGDGYGYGYGDCSGEGYGNCSGYGFGLGYGYGSGHGDGFSESQKMIFERDGLSLEIDKPPKVYKTRDNHTVEQYEIDGEKKYFVTLSGQHYCAHGSTLEEAITDATWKDEEKRPSLEELKQEIQNEGQHRKITINEFKLLTGACSEGCRVALKREGLDGSPMTAKEVYKHFPEWGKILLNILEWGE